MDRWYWIVVLVWLVLQGIGSAAAAKAKKRAEEERRRRLDREPLPAPGSYYEPEDGEDEEEVWNEPELEPVPRRSFASGPQSADEIAAEIRRVMGLEREEPPRLELIRERPEPEPEPEVRAGLNRGRLHEQLALRERSGQFGLGQLGNRHLAALRTSHVEQRHTGSAQVGRITRVRAMTRTGYRGSAFLDLSDVGRAFVTMEVLGPPLALREDPWRMSGVGGGPRREAGAAQEAPQPTPRPDHS